jgi:hypothetical protein
MIELNLLPDIKKDYIKALRTRTRIAIVSMLVILIAVGAVVASILYVYVAQNLLIKNRTAVIAEKKDELEKKPNTTLNLTIQNQLDVLPELHEKKAIYSRMMDMLPVMNPSAPNSVSLTNLTINNDTKTMAFNGTSETFEALSVFQESLKYTELTTYTTLEDGRREDTKSPLFSEVVIESSSLGQINGKPKVSFVIRTTYNEQAFSFLVDGASVNVPQRQSSQEVQTNDIFEEQ